MLTKKDIVVRSALYFGILIGADVVISLVVALIFGVESGVVFFDTATFVEMALMFLAGGLYDWSASEWAVGVRRISGTKGVEYSPEKHQEADRKGIACVLSGVYLLVFAFILTL